MTSSAAVPTQLQRTERILAEGLKAGDHPGVQLYASLRGEPVELCLGVARPGVPMAPDHLLPWLSAGKPLTAVAVAQLWEAGGLDLDDAVDKHVPEFGVGGKESITLRHLLTHTAGFRSKLDLEGRPQSWDEVVRQACSARRERGWIPGRRAGYQARAGWHLLGEIVRRITGEELAPRVRERVLLPAGMASSWLATDTDGYSTGRARMADLFITSGEEPTVDEALGGEAAALHCAPGASARGPMADLGRFYEMMLAGGVGTGGERVLTAQTVEAMTLGHRVGLMDESFRHVVDWGLGFVIDSNRYGADTVPYGYGRHCSTRTYGHGGSQCCVGFADPEHGLVVALAVNGRPGEARHQERFRRALTALYEDLELTEGEA